MVHWFAHIRTSLALGRNRRLIVHGGTHASFDILVLHMSTAPSAECLHRLDLGFRGISTPNGPPR